MSNAELGRWANEVLSSLNVNQQDFFSRLWSKKKLSFDGDKESIDIIDEAGAKLICAALENRQLLLNVLPDDEERRAPLIFGTALLQSAVKCIENNTPASTVLYYGTSGGFKSSLSHTSISDIYLDTVFNTHEATKTYKGRKGADQVYSEYLPSVYCVYHPIHPDRFIQIYNPKWVAIDCGNESYVDWLSPLLEYCQKKNIPAIGWSTNCFSEVIPTFEKFGARVFFSPKPYKLGRDFGEVLVKSESRSLTPVIFDGDKICIIDNLFVQVKQLLLSFSGVSLFGVQKDGIRLVWNLVRQLEKLTLPLNIYNEEVRAFWNVYSIDEIFEGANKYATLIRSYDDKVGKVLEEAIIKLQQVSDIFSETEPPYWSALAEYCTERSESNTLTVIVFPSRAQKRLFSRTLLARFNISEEELQNDSRVIFKTIKEIASHAFKKITFEYPRINPLIVGLPDSYNTSFFYKCINRFDSRILIYPHQISTLRSILRNYNLQEGYQRNVTIETLRVLSKSRSNVVTLPTSDRYALASPFQKIKIDISNSTRVRIVSSNDDIEIGDFHSELARLLESGRDDDDAGFFSNITLESDPKDVNEKKQIIIESSLEVKLEDEYYMILDPSEQINVVTGAEVRKMYARALSKGNRILCIENQAKKDIYALLLDRIYDHRSLSIFLSLLQKWREEFYQGYMQWKDKNPGMGLYDFWVLLKAKGSEIEVPVTINNWLTGNTLRPQDSANILRVGEVLGNKFITEHHKDIAIAASRIVGLHVSLSRKLKHWFEDSSFDMRRDDNILISDELGLTLGEIRSSMKILRVEAIGKLTEPILRSSTGILMKGIPHG